MTQQQPRRPSAAQASRKAWDPPMRIAQAIRVNGGDASPPTPHPVVANALSVRPTAVRPAGRGNRQLAAAVAGKPVKALPTRTARRTRRRVRHTVKIVHGWLAGLGALLVLAGLVMLFAAALATARG